MATNDAQKKAFYTKQREDAEAGAAKGDRKAAGTAAKIYGKLSKKDDSGLLGGLRNTFLPSEQQSKRNYYSEESRLGKGNADLDKFTGDVINSTVSGELGGQLFGALGKFAKGAASRFVPKAATGIKATESAAAQTASKARQNLGKAKAIQKPLPGNLDKMPLNRRPESPVRRAYEVKGGGTTKPSIMGAARPQLSSAQRTEGLPGPKSASKTPQPGKVRGGTATSPRDLLKNATGLKDPSTAQKVGRGIKDAVGKAKQKIGDLKYENDRIMNPNFKRDQQMKSDASARRAMARADKAEARSKKGR